MIIVDIRLGFIHFLNIGLYNQTVRTVEIDALCIWAYMYTVFIRSLLILYPIINCLAIARQRICLFLEIVSDQWREPLRRPLGMGSPRYLLGSQVCKKAVM